MTIPANTSKSRLALLCLLFAPLLLTPKVLRASPGTRDAIIADRYTAIDIGTLGGNISFATAINNHGVVIGRAKDKGGRFRAFLWEFGRIRDIGTLGGSWSRAFGINDNGLVVGDSATVQPRNSHAFVWKHGQIKDLGRRQSYASQAISVNYTGVIAGTYDLRGVPTGCYWDSRGVHKLAAHDAINSKGISPNREIVGTVVIAGHTFETAQAFIWRQGRISILPVPSTVNSSTATAINKNATAVGWIEDYVPMTIAKLGTGNKPCKWALGNKPQFERISSSIGSANALNDSGLIVGEIDVPNGDSHAALWLDGKEIDLNTAIPSSEHWILEQATGINNKDQIVGWGVHNGHRHAFLLNPTK